MFNLKYVLGIDVGGTSIKIGLFDENQKLILTDVLKTNKKENGKYILEELANKIKGILKVKKISNDDLLGIGFGVPGPVINNYVVRCPNIGWEDLYLEREFISLLGFETLIEITNDATVAAYGEFFVLKDKSDMAFMTLGTGVGGGLVINGKVIEGTHGSAGEFGHIQVEYDNPTLCSCGLLGCLETRASIRGINSVAKEVLEQNNFKTKLDINNLSPRTTYDYAKQGDIVANIIVDKVGDYIAKAAAKIAAVVDPKTIVIGGGISKAGNILIESVEKAYPKYSYFGTKNLKFRLATLGNDAGMVGASQLIFRKI